MLEIDPKEGLIENSLSKIHFDQNKRRRLMQRIKCTMLGWSSFSSILDSFIDKDTSFGFSYSFLLLFEPCLATLNVYAFVNFTI